MGQRSGGVRLYRGQFGPEGGELGSGGLDGGCRSGDLCRHADVLDASRCRQLLVPLLAGEKRGIAAARFLSQAVGGAREFWPAGWRQAPRCVREPRHALRAARFFEGTIAALLPIQTERLRGIPADPLAADEGADFTESGAEAVRLDPPQGFQDVDVAVAAGVGMDCPFGAAPGARDVGAAVSCDHLPCSGDADASGNHQLRLAIELRILALRRGLVPAPQLLRVARPLRCMRRELDAVCHQLCCLPTEIHAHAGALVGRVPAAQIGAEQDGARA